MSKKLGFINLAIRGLSLFAKFLLILYLAKYFSLKELGIFGLFNTAVVLGVLLLGFDFYRYNTREILAENTKKRVILIRNQFVFHFIFYIFLMPFFYIFYIIDVVPRPYFGYFVCILIIDHINQEFYRLLSTLSMPLKANWQLFFRSGLWIYLLLLSWEYKILDFKSLENIFQFWLYGEFSSLLVSIIFFKKINLEIEKNEPPDWMWIKKGILVSIPFVVGTISYKIIEFSNRFFIDSFYGKKEVGIFTFFSGIANILNLVIFTTIVMIYYPKIVESYHSGDMPSFNKIFKIFKINIIRYSILLSLLIVPLTICLLYYIGKEELLTFMDLFILLILGNMFFNLSYIPHYLLYIERKDKQIMYSTVLSGLLNLLLNYICIVNFGLIGIGWSFMFSFLSLYLLKLYNTR